MDRPIHKAQPDSADVHVDTIMNARRRALKKKRMRMDAALSKRGDYPGHPFRGNQWTGGISRGGRGAVVRRGGAGVSSLAIDAMAAKKPAPKQKSMRQMQREVDGLTPAQAKRYWSSSGSHEDGMKAALGAKYVPPAAPKPAKAAAPKKNAKPPRDADGDSPPQATDPKTGQPKFDKDGNPVWLKPTPRQGSKDPGPKAGDPKRFSDTGGDAVAAGMRRPTNYELKYGVLDDQGNRYRIPGNNRDVWVSNSPSGNNRGLIVSSIDDLGRAQPVYTASFRARQDAAKFSKIDKLAKDISKIDTRLRQDMAKGDERALALGLIRATGIRSGSTEKGTGGKAGSSFGATSLLASHVTVTNKGVRVQFPGKKGKAFDVTVDSPPELVAGLRNLKNSRSGTRGATLFDQKRASYERTSDYLKEISGSGDYTLHNLRTLKATESAAALVRSLPIPKTPAELKKLRMQVGKEVGLIINDGAKVALTSYIHPAVFANWEKAVASSGSV